MCPTPAISRTKLTRAAVTQTMSGAIEGDAKVDWPNGVPPATASARFVELHVIDGTIGDRTGSVVIQSAGDFDGNEATAERARLGELIGRVLAGMIRPPGATRWMCRLFDTTVCGRPAGQCPVVIAATGPQPSGRDPDRGPRRRPAPAVSVGEPAPTRRAASPSPSAPAPSRSTAPAATNTWAWRPSGTRDHLARLQPRAPQHGVALADARWPRRGPAPRRWAAARRGRARR